MNLKEIALQSLNEERVVAAQQRWGTFLRRSFSSMGVTFPPSAIFLRAFKMSSVLELWGACDTAAPMVHLLNFQLEMVPGYLGPKQKEGDQQMPEGIYAINRLNPRSRFLLSLGLDYPNESDKMHADPDAPGSDIFIHGGAASKGCLAVGDAGIEQLFLIVSHFLALAPEGTIVPIHIFPTHMNGSIADTLRPIVGEENLNRHNIFWQALQEIFSIFESTKRVPIVVADCHRFYRVKIFSES